MKRLLTLAAMFLCCMATTFAQYSGSGSGTESDPYLILNPIQLNQLRNFLNQRGVYFKLMADIDLTKFIEYEYGSQGWLPIGTSSSSFNGVLDGNGKTISNLRINRSTEEYIGLFGNTYQATIKNLRVTGEILGCRNVGMLSGNSDNCIIQNCFFEGIVKGTENIGGCIGCAGGYMEWKNISSIVEVTGGNCTGGIVGKRTSVSNGPMINCHAQAKVIGGDYTGGICGYSMHIDFTNCNFIGSVNANSYAGGICGYSLSGVIDNSFSTGQIIATGDIAGGLAGYSYHPNSYEKCVKNCYFSGSVIGKEQVGGLIGNKVYGRIDYCASMGSVSGINAVGGLVGKIQGEVNGVSAQCYSNVTIPTFLNASEGNVGRIYGEKKNAKFSESKSYDKAIVIGAGVVQNVANDEQNGEGISATLLKMKATYVAWGWDFNDIWEIQETECYPYLKTQTAPPVITSQVVSGATTISGKCVKGSTITLEIDGMKQQIVSNGYTFSFTVSPLAAGHEVRISAKIDGKEQSYYTTEIVSYLGKGTEADPYQVYTASDLTGVYRKGYFKLMNDIDLTDYISQFSPTEGWESIGREGSETIHFDGNGHKITGLWCNSTRDNTGLFSCFANGTIKNLTIEVANGKQVKGGSNTGILIGKMINGTIENCRISGAVADGTPVGGIVGLFDDGTISRCLANVTINATVANSYVGGLIGESTDGTIDQCLTEGTLTAIGTESYVGGLIGKNSAKVTNSYSNAEVKSSYNAAGLVAYNYGLVDKCYATGDLFSNNYAAGVIGYNEGSNAIIQNCVAMNNKIDVVYESQQTQQGGGYAQRIIGGINENAPAPEMNNYALKTMLVSLNDFPRIVYDDIMNGVAKTDEELKQKVTYTSLGWNFTETWAITEKTTYPYLQWLIDNNNNVLVTDIRLNISTLSLVVGENRTLNAILTPEDASNTCLQWTSSNKTVATVENGVVTAVASGLATITATTTDGSNLSATCSVTVKDAGSNPTEIDVTDISQMDNVIYVEPMEARTGTEAVISFKMKNSAEIRAFQFDLYLPQGVTVVKSAKGKIQGALSPGRLPDEDEHTLTFSEHDGFIRFLCGSQYDETFTGNDGEIATLRVNIAEDIREGDYALQLKDMKLTETDISKFYETAFVQSKLTVYAYVTGDISGDGVVDVSDYTGVANHIHGNTPEGFNAKAADVDQNNVIDVSDYTGIANIIHTGSIYGNNSSNAPRMLLSPKRVNTDLSTYDNVIYISPFTASANSQISLSIKMKNMAEIRGFQFDLYLPEGMTVVKSEKGRIQGSLSPGRLPDEDEHELTFSEHDGFIRFLCSSQYNETFTGNDGEIATLKVNIAEDMEAGEHAILMKKMKLTETDISKFYTAELIETTVNIGGTGTGIDCVDNRHEGEESYYNLNGMRVEKPTRKGVYINNGKTIVVK